MRLPSIYIRGPYFRSIMTSHVARGSRARTRQRVETRFGWQPVTVDKSSVSRSASRDRSKPVSERRSRARPFPSQPARVSHSHLTFTIYALPSIPGNLRRVPPHYRIVLAGQKHAARLGYSWFNANIARKLALSRIAPATSVISVRD